ncbi:MAG: Rv3654c family TadE-like protein [Pseudonocardiaceae bacterium]
MTASVESDRAPDGRAPDELGTDELGTDDRGMATVWAAGVIAVLMILTVFGLHLGGVILARHHAESAADLAALAGAGSAVAGEGYACARARQVTDRMRVRLASCSARGWDVLVQVAAHPGGPAGRLGEATARARAGPAAPPSADAAEVISSPSRRTVQEGR